MTLEKETLIFTLINERDDELIPKLFDYYMTLAKEYSKRPLFFQDSEPSFKEKMLIYIILENDNEIIEELLFHLTDLARERYEKSLPENYKINRIREIFPQLAIEDDERF